MKKKQTVEELKNEIAGLPVGPSGRRRYPGAIRDAALEMLKAKRDEGWTQARLGAELGINSATLSNWRRERRACNPGAEKLRPVRLANDFETTEEPAGATRAVVLPNGVRVEGLNLEELVALVKVLA